MKNVDDQFFSYDSPKRGFLEAGFQNYIVRKQGFKTCVKIHCFNVICHNVPLFSLVKCAVSGPIT